MQQRTLGKSGLKVSSLGSGCMGLSFGLAPRWKRAGHRPDPRGRGPRSHLL